VPRSVRPTTAVVLLALCGLVASLAGCSSDGGSSGSPSTTAVELARPYAIGHLTETYVDRSRSTPGGQGRAELPERTLLTSIYYPAAGTPGGEVVEGAEPAEVGAPFPLVVLAHGLGGNEEYLTPLAQEWVAAGYVVALPHFPLTYAGTPGGIDGADVQNQPGDVSVVVDEVLAASAGSEGPLAGLVDPDAVALAGHSNGGITTFGAIANSCCRDERIRAALVLSGTPSPYVGGTYDFSDIPPLMVVHGVDDQLIAYDQAVDAFHQASPPKAFLSLGQSEHGDWLVPTDEAFAVTVRATTDFLDGYLRGDSAALERLPSDQDPPVATIYVALEDGSSVTVPTVPAPVTDRKATVSADTDLREGDVVTVTWSGFLPGKTVNVLQCTGDGRGGSASCGIAEGHVLVPDPSGSGTIELVIHTGPFANGVCDAANPCTILVNDAGLLDEDAFVYFPITFAA